jgi:sugar lactone lactonase YvrE
MSRGMWRLARMALYTSQTPGTTVFRNSVLPVSSSRCGVTSARVKRQTPSGARAGWELIANGRVYVMDTGNDRVVIFDADGNFITDFGSEGFDRGQLDEPTGIAIDQNSGKVFIADTWNQRIHVFVPSVGAHDLHPHSNLGYQGLAGESLENKPFLALSPLNGTCLCSILKGRACWSSPRKVNTCAAGAT